MGRASKTCNTNLTMAMSHIALVCALLFATVMSIPVPPQTDVAGKLNSISDQSKQVASQAASLEADLTGQIEDTKRTMDAKTKVLEEQKDLLEKNKLDAAKAKLTKQQEVAAAKAATTEAVAK